jgi:chaperonin GroES
MRVLRIASILACLELAQCFLPTTTTTTTKTTAFSRSIVITQETNVLEGKEIQNDFTPINNMLLVKKVDVVDQTGGGIFLTGKGKIEKSEGEVVSTGTGRINSETGFQSPMPISKGDIVTFGKFDGEELTYNDVKHTLIRDDDVLVKFPQGADVTLDNAEVISDNVLVKVVESTIKESGGILIAATAKKATISSIGEVLKVGPGKYAFNGALMEMDVAPGDMVKFRDYAAQEVEIDGVNYAVVQMTDLLAKF